MLKSLFLVLLIPVSGNFNPFSDEDLFSINWAGPIDLENLKVDGKQEVVTVQTEEHESYHCVLPESQASTDANKATYSGATPDELMNTLFSQSSCSYRIESYWTYELCHGKHIKQYHENKELGLQQPKLLEYYLGRIKDKKEDKEDKQNVNIEDKDESPDAETQLEAPPIQSQEILSMKIDGLDLPYYSVNMTDGTKCDLTGKSRLSHVKYICQPNGRGEIYLLKETSSCEYDIVVLTSVLCSHPQFKPKDPPVSKINCHAIGTSPLRPNRLKILESDSGIQLEAEEVIFTEGSTKGSEPPKPPHTEIHTKHTVVKPGQQPTPQITNKVIGGQADKQLLREFLAGEYCLHGGGGWWKHEFCNKKYAKQYHEDQEGSVSIVLGHWDKAKHLEWLSKNPTKRPKPVGQRTQLSLYYSKGNVCEETGKERFVEVKLKCLNKPDQPHAVSIYLVEPKMCEYILGVESPIFCGLIDKADDNGLLDHVKV